MLIREMFDHILLLSGQFTMTVENIELKEDNFAALVRLALGEYNKFCPRLRKFNIVTSDKFFKFVDGFTAQGETLGIPDWISDVKPVRILGIFPYYLNSLSPTGDTSRSSNNSNIDNKTFYPWEWRSPNLYLPITGTYDIEAIFKYRVTKNESDKWEVKTLDFDNDKFFRLLTGHFLLSLGRNRRAFTLGDLPIQSDADTLASEGADTLQMAREAMADDSMFWLAWS